jgi:hypothetical protein
VDPGPGVDERHVEVEADDRSHCETLSLSQAPATLGP